MTPSEDRLRRLDEAIVEAIADDTLPRSQVLERLEHRPTLQQWYSAIERLVAAGRVERVGRTKGMRYRLTSTEGTYV